MPKITPEIKNENLFDKIMQFFVHNGFLITATDMCLTHLALLIILYLADVAPLVTFNIISVSIYAFCILMCRLEKPMFVYVCILLEVSLYSILGTHYVGWNSGTAFFLCAIIPVTIYFGNILFNKYRRLLIAVFTASIFALYVFLYLKYNQAVPLYSVPWILNECLVILSSFTMVFSTIFYNSVYIFSMRLKTEKLKSDNKQLQYEASRDGLTGWLNRSGFLPLVIDHICNTDQKLSIAFVDIDNFKRINDSYGHDCGDDVLQHITRLIKNNLGEDCLYCRWGGEELVIALKDYDITAAAKAMDVVRHVIEESYTIFYNKHIKVTTSIGVAEYFRDSSNLLPVKNQLETIITLADERMYKAKQSGKNIVVCE